MARSGAGGRAGAQEPASAERPDCGGRRSGGGGLALSAEYIHTCAEYVPLRSVAKESRSEASRAYIL